LGIGPLRTVLVLIPSLSNTVFIDALAGIEAVLQAAGYQMLIGTHYSSDEELALLRLSAAQPGWPAGDRAYPACGLPPDRRASVAACGLHDGFERGWPALRGIFTGSGRCQHDQHLLARGKRHIAFMGAQLDERVMKRLAGYRLALQQAGCYNPALEWLDPAPSSMQMGADMLDACSPPIRLVMLFFAAMTTWPSALLPAASSAALRCQHNWPSAVSTTCSPPPGPPATQQHCHPAL
jgi:LacI family gluconate utilization system Gnt-I transcriptional repressor